MSRGTSASPASARSAGRSATSSGSRPPSSAPSTRQSRCRRASSPRGPHLGSSSAAPPSRPARQRFRRSARTPALTSVLVMTTNHITSLHIRSVPVLDQDEALEFYTTHLGFEVRDDVDLGFMRWLTVGVPGQDTSLLLELVGGPQHDESTAAQVRELVTKGALGGVFLLSDDVHATYAALRDAGVEVTQEPVEQPYGTDFGIRDPFGNHVRISQPNGTAPEQVQDAYDAAATR